MPSAENPDSVKLRSIADAFSMVLEASPLDNGSPLVDELRAIANRLEHPERHDPRWALAYTLDIDAGGLWRASAHHNGAIYELTNFGAAVGTIVNEQSTYGRRVRDGR